MDPVLGGIVEELQQHVDIAGDLGDRLRVLGAEVGVERLDRGPGMVDVLGPADERTASPTTTAVRIPAGIEDAALRAAARARYGVVFSSGRGETLGKLVRIGHMGPTARPMYAVVALAGLGGALRALGHPLDVAAGMAAALAAIDRGLD